MRIQILILGLQRVNIANYASLFAMQLSDGDEKITCKAKITPSCQTNRSSKHYIKPYKLLG